MKMPFTVGREGDILIQNDGATWVDEIAINRVEKQRSSNEGSSNVYCTIEAGAALGRAPEGK